MQLTLAVFFGGLGLGQTLYGPISDRYGRTRPLCFGLSLFVLASAACAPARSIEGLVAWRFVLPNVMAAARASQGRNAGSASALLGAVQFGAGAVVGMLLGALGNGTAVPMAGLIAACGLSALAVHRLGRAPSAAAA